MKLLKYLLLLLLMGGLIPPVWSDQKADDFTLGKIKNSSVKELSESVQDSITLASVIILAPKNKAERGQVLKALGILDKQVRHYIYPDSVYKVISDEATRKKIQEKSALKLFDQLDKSARTINNISKKCFSIKKLSKYKTVDSAKYNKDKKQISYVIQYGTCGKAKIILSDVSNIDGSYYFTGITASAFKEKETESVVVATVKKLENKNTENGVVIEFQYELAGLFKSGVAPAKKDGLWGIIDAKGAWLVSPQYTSVGRISEGLLAVEKEGKFTFIDATIESSREALTKFKFDNVDYYSDSLAGVKIGKKWGFIGTAGKLKIPAKYESVRSFKNGFAPVKYNKKWGYINEKGQWLAKPIYNAAYSFADGGLAVVVVRNKRGFVNTKARFVIKPVYRRVQRFSDGIAPVSKKKASWYFVGKDNKIAFSGKFSEARTFSEGVTAVMNKNKKWGYINKEGKQIIPYQFDKAYDFKESLALVKKDNKRGFINKQGDIIIPLIYEDAYRFSEGLAPVKKDGLWGYIRRPIGLKK